MKVHTTLISALFKVSAISGREGHKASCCRKKAREGKKKEKSARLAVSMQDDSIPVSVEALDEDEDS